MTVSKFALLIMFLSLLLYIRTDLMDYGVSQSESNRSSTIEAHSVNYNRDNGSELRSIYFVHIPKTGGTTIGNILNRVILQRNLTFPMFSGLFPWPNTDPLKSIVNLKQLESGRKFDILHRHTMYNKTALDLLFVKDRLVKVTLLRKPLDQLKSLFNFADLASFFHMSSSSSPSDPVQVFLQNISLYDRPHLGRSPGEMSFSWTRDFSASFFKQELPLTSQLMIHSHTLQLVNFLERELDLVMIQEYFDESLLFLQELSGLSLHELLYLDVRKSLYAYKHRVYSNKLVKNFEQWSHTDCYVYSHFRHAMERRITNAGAIFQRKLEHFRRINHKVRLFCSEILDILFKLKRKAIEKYYFINAMKGRFYKVDASVFSPGFSFTSTECVTLAIDPNILELSLFCQKHANPGHSKCQGRNRIFTAQSDLKISGVIPVEMFERDSGFGWPLLWGRVPLG